MVHTEVIEGGKGKKSGLSEAKRFLRLSELEHSVVVLSELNEGITILPDQVGGAGAATSVKVLSKTEDAGKEITSPVFEVVKPGLADFQRDVSLVGTYTDLRRDRLQEIHIQIEDIYTFFGAATPLHPGTYTWTLEMLAAAVEFATMVVQRIKLSLGAPRPELFSPLMQPIIQTPSHGSFPSGHSTQAFTVATMLAALRGGAKPDAVPNIDDQFFKIATRIAVNRTVAGVHYPSDSAAGAALGVSIARLILNRLASSKATASGFKFDGTNYVFETTDGDRLSRDFHLGELEEMFNGSDSAMSALGDYTAYPAHNFSMLWSKAQEEWSGVWG